MNIHVWTAGKRYNTAMNQCLSQLRKQLKSCFNNCGCHWFIIFFIRSSYILVIFHIRLSGYPWSVMTNERPWRIHWTPFNVFSFNFSASVVKEQGVYWEGISVTLGCKLLLLRVLIHWKTLWRHSERPEVSTRPLPLAAPDRHNIQTADQPHVQV